MPWFSVEAPHVSAEQIEAACSRLLAEARTRISSDLKRVLLLPPDLTRAHSGAGRITELLYTELTNAGAHVEVIPTLGQHIPHTPEENRWMFGAIPEERIFAHDWRNGCTHVGTIPGGIVAETTEGVADWEIPVDLNTKLMDEQWDLIINIGHVVPHEVLGFANHNKNYYIGLGGKDTICASHIAAAVYGIEKNLGCLVTPLRACYNWSEDRHLASLPDVYLQIVMHRDDTGALVTSGIFVGDDLDTYLEAARLSRDQNIITFAKPVKKIVAVMQGDEFRSTWVGNKAVYRTRMALADGGETADSRSRHRALRRADGGRCAHPQVRLHRHRAHSEALPERHSRNGRHAGDSARRRAPHPWFERGPLHHPLRARPPVAGGDRAGGLRVRRPR